MRRYVTIEVEYSPRSAPDVDVKLSAKAEFIEGAVVAVQRVYSTPLLREFKTGHPALSLTLQGFAGPGVVHARIVNHQREASPSRMGNVALNLLRAIQYTLASPSVMGAGDVGKFFGTIPKELLRDAEIDALAERLTARVIQGLKPLKTKAPRKKPAAKKPAAAKK